MSPSLQPAPDEQGFQHVALLVTDVATALTRHRDLEPLLQAVCEAVVRRLDASFARVWTVSPDGHTLELQASAGLYTHLDGPHARVPIGKFKIGGIAHERRAHLTNDVQNDPRVSDQAWATREGMVAFAGYPLIVAEELVGVIALFARRTLSDDVIRGLAGIADMVAVGIARCQTERQRLTLLQAARRHAQQMRDLADASLAITQAQSLEATLQVITQRAAAIIGAHQAETCVTPQGAEHQATSAVYLSDKYGAPQTRTVRARMTGLATQICASNRPVRMTQAEVETHPARGGDGDARRGWLAAPLIARDGNNLGLVHLSDRCEGEFTEEDEQLLVQLARLASVALENARLFRQADELIRALATSNRELDQFAYVASHDLKAPLRGIANLSQWLEEDVGPALPPEAIQHLAMMRGRVHRMEALIDGILHYSRAGKEQARELVDIRELVEGVCDLMAVPPEVRLEIAPDLPRLTAERVPLQQVFMNLIGNAIKHARHTSPTVQIGGRDAGDQFEFWVSDNGPGISPRYHERIWGLFQTLLPRDRVEGTGIGLSVVKKIVDARGGRAWVESEEGSGATFKFTWPKEHGRGDHAR